MVMKNKEMTRQTLHTEPLIVDLIKVKVKVHPRTGYEGPEGE
jgi:hypothetical protein